MQNLPTPSEITKAPLSTTHRSHRGNSRRLPSKAETDARLVKSALKGHKDSFNLLVTRHQSAARRTAFMILKDYQAAEDSTQCAFVKAYKRLHTLKDPRKFSSWLLRTVQCTALDYRRTRKDHLSIEGVNADAYALVDRKKPIVMQLEELEDDLEIIKIIRKLRPDYQELFELKHIKNLTYREISLRLDMTISGVGEKLSRIRQLIKQRFRNHPPRKFAKP